MAAGIYTQVESEQLNMVGLSAILTSPGIILIVLGGVIFLIGFFGCLGALREIFLLLVIVSSTLSLLSQSVSILLVIHIHAVVCRGHVITGAG